MRRAVAVIAMLWAPLALAKPEQCLGHGTSQWIIDETLVATANPDGPENQLRVAVCRPLYDRPGILFDYAALEYGVFSYVSPVYVHQGAYVAITPLSFMSLRADAAGVFIWPLPLSGAGYYGKTGYVKTFNDSDLKAGDARFAGGLNLTFTLTLQGEVPLTDRVRLQAVNSFSGDYWYVGDQPYWVNLRRDVVLAKSDWLIKENVFAGLAIELDPRWTLRVGAVDDVNWVPRAGYLANILAGFVSLPFRREGLFRDVEPFVRLGAYTAHAFRTGAQLFTGISVAWAFPYERQ